MNEIELQNIDIEMRDWTEEFGINEISEEEIDEMEKEMGL